MMFCKKCGGRMCVDRTFSDNKRFDVYCLICGKRAYVSRFDNAFGVWLDRREKAFANASAL